MPLPIGLNHSISTRQYDHQTINNQSFSQSITSLFIPVHQYLLVKHAGSDEFNFYEAFNG